MNTERFPVVDERALLRPDRRWMVGPWRDPAQLPVLPPGCVYIFAVDGDYRDCPTLGHPQGTEPEVVKATSVSIVNVRYRRITATAWLPSTDTASDFVVRVVFGCKVSQPRIVAAQGLVDLQDELDVRVRHDERLLELHHAYEIERIDEVRRRIIADIGQAYREHPPAVAGMIIDFEGVHVHTPRELRRHRIELRDTRWFREEEELKEQVELKRVQHTEQLLKTPQKAEATAIARNESTMEQAAQRRFQEHDLQTQRLIDQVEAWISGDGGKRAPIDRRHLAEELFRRLTDQAAPEPSNGSFAYAHQHTNGHADLPRDEPRIPPDNRIDGI